LCIDEIAAISGITAWEEALFHLYNRVRASNTCLVVTGRVPPPQLPLKLADLRSRLSWGMVYHINELADADKLAVLQIHANLRGIELTDEVAKFILQRSNRSMVNLFSLLESLDKASLTQKRRVTIPFVKDVLQI